MKSTPILSFPILLPSPPLHLLTSCLKFHWVHLVLPNMCMGVGPSSKSMKWLLRAYVSEKKKTTLPCSAAINFAKYFLYMFQCNALTTYEIGIINSPILELRKRT